MMFVEMSMVSETMVALLGLPVLTTTCEAGAGLPFTGAASVSPDEEMWKIEPPPPSSAASQLMAAVPVLVMVKL